MKSDIEVLISHYGFDLGGLTAEDIVDRWLEVYEENWVRLAAIEAIYLGRYKAISVEQILRGWERQGQANYHFQSDFERLICRNVPRQLKEFRSPPKEFSLPNPSVYARYTPSARVREEDEASAIAPEPEYEDPAPIGLADESQFQGDREEYEEHYPKEQHRRRCIDRFIPLPDRSGFFHKLKAVANQAGHEVIQQQG